MQPVLLFMNCVLTIQMFDANSDGRGVDNNEPEDTRLHGYDPLIPPALIQEEIPAVGLPKDNYSPQFFGLL
jgi:hypothetical protein